MSALRKKTMMLPFAKPAGPCIIWRNPGAPRGTRKAEYRNTVAEGRKYEVLERACEGGWVVVTELTIVDGQPQVAA
jgi:hypothetical protein